MSYVHKGLGAIMASASLFAIPAVAEVTHPLDGLEGEEYQAVTQILRDEGRLTDSGRFPLIELVEPDKSFVLDWEEGDTIPRTARAIVKDKGSAYEAVIDLNEGKIVSWNETGGQSMLLFDEFIKTMDLALGHPDMVEGLQARGLTPNDVFCLPLTAGNFLTEEEQGGRLMKVPCYLNPEASNFYAKPIEGLVALVDLNAMEVVEVIDTGAIPLPEDPWGYTDEEIDERYGLREESSPAELTQPGGANFTIEGSQVEWDIWRFNYRIDKRPGLVLSNIAAKDDDDWRSVLYQAHLSEVFVPYMDPDEGWYWRTYMDSGEYGFGLFLTPLRPRVDCPAHSTFLPAMVHTDTGEPLEIPDAICVFERSTGDPIWRHYEIFAQSEEEAVPTEGRPWTELVVRTASQIGNYDYLIDYVFMQDGRIRVMVGSTGLDAVKGVASKSMNDDTAEQDTTHGTLIAPNLVAPNHDHFFNFRFDFDIDGQENTFMRTGIVPATVEDDAIRRSMWTTEMSVPETEKEAQYRVNPNTPAMYHVTNTNKESGLGHNPGYMILPNNSVAYSPLDVVNDAPAIRNAYIDKTFWVTPYDKAQRYAGGEYAFQSTGEDTLPKWAEEGRSVKDKDIVVWYTMGFHHIPRMEDWPVMPTMWKGTILSPFNFFDHNPSITVRTPE
ncbi:hypothetical protein LG290_07625 [Halomonas sediminis]